MFKLVLWVQLSKVLFVFWTTNLKINTQILCPCNTLLRVLSKLLQIESSILDVRHPFLIFVWLNICLYHSAAVSCPQLTPSCCYLLFHPCVCHPQTLSLFIWISSPKPLMITQHKHPSSVESRGDSSWWEWPDGHLLDGDGDNLFPNESQWLWKKLPAHPCLFGVGLCFVLHWRSSQCSVNILYILQGSLQEKMNSVCLKFRESLFFISRLHANTKNYPNHCLLNTLNHFLFSAFA